MFEALSAPRTARREAIAQLEKRVKAHGLMAFLGLVLPVIIVPPTAAGVCRSGDRRRSGFLSLSAARTASS